MTPPPDKEESGRVSARPSDPRDGNEWEEIGKLVSMDVVPLTPAEEAEWRIAKAKADLDLIPETEERE